MLCILVVYVLGMTPQLVNAKTNKGINIKKNFVKGVGEEISGKWYDKNQDGYLSKKEIKQIKELYLYSEYEDFNLKGISKLKYLEKIKIDPKYYLYNIRELKKLRNLKYVDISIDSKQKKYLILESVRILKH